MSAKKFRFTLAVIGIQATLFIATSNIGFAQSRTWQDSTGVFKVVAELVGVADGTVSLKKEDGQIVSVPSSRLSSDDQQYIKDQGDKAAGGAGQNVSPTELTGKPKEIANDDGEAAGKKSFPRGIASAFKAESDDLYLTAIKFHGGRYGLPRPPSEDFTITLCEKDFKTITDFKFPYSRVDRGDQKWVTLRVKPTKLPREFVLCLNFNPTSTKGVYVSHDAEGKSLVGLPDKPEGSFTGGDWMVRAVTDTLK